MFHCNESSVEGHYQVFNKRKTWKEQKHTCSDTNNVFSGNIYMIFLINWMFFSLSKCFFLCVCGGAGGAGLSTF